jgi:hypothetical protein
MVSIKDRVVEALVKLLSEISIVLPVRPAVQRIPIRRHVSRSRRR